MRFERVTMKHPRGGQVVVVPGAAGTESFTHLPTSDTSTMTGAGEEDLDFLADDEDEPEAIKIRVVSVEWPRGLPSNSTAIPDVVGRLVRLPIPKTLPDPNSMHIFVQFQVRLIEFPMKFQTNSSWASLAHYGVSITGEIITDDTEYTQYACLECWWKDERILFC